MQEKVLACKSVQALLDALDAKTFTCEQLLMTFVDRCIQIAHGLNLLADINFEEALESARRCDRERQAGTHKGLLHGIPMSIKDDEMQKGLDCTLGSQQFCFDPMPEDGFIVRMLKAEGAIPFVRSNVPQGLMIPETVCSHWGRALNPISLGRTVGGSSGGEAGLIATQCSPRHRKRLWR